LDAKNYPALIDYLKTDAPLSLGVDFTSGFLSTHTPPMKLSFLIKRVKEVYCGKIAYEFKHITNREHVNWIKERIETLEPNVYTKDQKKFLWDRIAYSDKFEKFLGMTFPTAKRFGLEGGESLIPGLDKIIESASNLGVESFVFGMAHRGRLNVLQGVLRKPTEDIMREFRGAIEESEGGDVKYHLGMSMARTLPNGKRIHMSLVANPSHLEAVNPVVEGKTCAKQFYTKDVGKKKTMSILIHGDAAFAGQGVNYECMGLSDLPAYSTGGTIHIIVNNQIGFTTNPRQSRSSPYCSDLAKFIEAPIFHVNGDDPEAVVFICNLAAEWRQTFNKDVVIDIVGYRRQGHNETDQPLFTQPKMYMRIAKHLSTYEIYSNQLIKEGVITADEKKAKDQEVIKFFENAYQKSQTNTTTPLEWFREDSVWRNFKSEKYFSPIRVTGVEKEILLRIGSALTTCPIEVHSLLQRQMRIRQQMFQSGVGLDWSTAEALAFGSLLEREKYHVRLSGQDSERGTFSQRHAVLVEQSEKETKYIPLNHISKHQAPFTVCNSSLSEFAVLGFEFGYSGENPYSLVCWEAQFGDFANGGQVIIDQFIAASEDKWRRQSGLVLLLPHGYDGQGPEHSSARPERFLQLSDEDPDVFPEMSAEKRMQIQTTNMQIVNCTTPANYFHVLRRQCLRDFRKPLIVFTPKSLLRHKMCVSNLSEFLLGTKFTRVFSDLKVDLVHADEIRKVLFCTGKVYYDLFEHREMGKINNVAIVRLEQLAPFPFDRVFDECRKYKNAELVWVQEEPKNMGAWAFVYFRFITALKGPKGNIKDPRVMSYIGRSIASSPATASPSHHKKEDETIKAKAFQ
jgi:2-oxoglutarate dehydrogenase E1 component